MDNDFYPDEDHNNLSFQVRDAKGGPIDAKTLREDYSKIRPNVNNIKVD